MKAFIKNHPQIKQFILRLIFQAKPYNAKVNRLVWLVTIFPRYFQPEISWKARLDLAPFQTFRVGKKTRIEKGVVINNGMGDIYIQNHVYIGKGSILIAPLTIHEKAVLGKFVRIIGMHHGIAADIPHHYQPCYRAPICIGKGAYIENGVVIMGKKNGEILSIGKYARIGADSVILRDVPDYAYVKGNPGTIQHIWNPELIKNQSRKIYTFINE